MLGLDGETYIFAPLIAFVLIGFLILILRWAFGHGGSLVPGPARRGPPTEYGLLVEVAATPTTAEAEVTVQRLAEAGLSATIAPTTAGPRVMVWPRDESRAREILGA